MLLRCLILVLAVLGAAESPALAKDTQGFQLPDGAFPHDVAPAPDGKVWYSAQRNGALGILDPATGQSREVKLGPKSAPHGVIQGPDGAAWLTDGGQNAIARVDPKADDEVKVWKLPATSGYANLNTGRFDRDVVPGTRVLILEAGANDGLQGVQVATLRRNLTSMIERAQARNIRVLLCGMETPPTYGLDYSVAFHFIFPTLAQQQSVPLVPFLLAGVALAPDLNGSDLVHPNAAGARRIAETVWTYLGPMLQN